MEVVRQPSTRSKRKKKQKKASSPSPPAPEPVITVEKPAEEKEQQNENINIIVGEISQPASLERIVSPTITEPGFMLDDGGIVEEEMDAADVAALEQHLNPPPPPAQVYKEEEDEDDDEEEQPGVDEPGMDDAEAVVEEEQLQTVVEQPILQQQQQEQQQPAAAVVVEEEEEEEEKKQNIYPVLSDVASSLETVITSTRELRSDRVCEELLASYGIQLRHFTDWFKRTSMAFDDEFYRRVDAYRQALLAVDGGNKRFHDACANADDTQGRLWTMKKVSVSQNKKCFDDTIIRHQYEYETAEFQAPTLVQLSGELDNIRDVHMQVMAAAVNNRLVSLLNVESFLYDFMVECGLNDGIGDGAIVPASQHAPEEVCRRLRTYIDILFHFARLDDTSSNVPVTTQFIADVRRWLKILVDRLYTRGTLVDHRYVFLHVVRTRGCSQWSSMVQFTTAMRTHEPKQQGGYQPVVFHDALLTWTPETRGHFVLMIMVFLSPLRPRRQSSSQQPQQQQQQREQQENDNDVVNMVKDVENEWVEIDERAPEELMRLLDGDTSPRLVLNESDFSAIIQQFPFRNFMESLFRDMFRADVTSDALSRGFGTAKVVLSLLANGLTVLVEFTQFGKLVARTISWISWIIVEVYAQAQATGFEFSESAKRQYQRELDWIVLRSVAIINEAQQPGVKFFLSDFPFKYVSAGAAACIFTALFENQPAQMFARSDDSLFPRLTTSEWQRRIDADASFRQRFAQHLIDQGPNRVYTLEAMSKVCRQQSGDLPAIFIGELFHVTYVNEVTRYEMFRDSDSLFGAVCRANVSIISLVWRLVYEQFAFIAHASVSLMQALPLHAWRPNKVDLEHIRDFLDTSYSTAESEVARHLIEQLDLSIHILGMAVDVPKLHHGAPDDDDLVYQQQQREIQEAFDDDDDDQKTPSHHQQQQRRPSAYTLAPDASLAAATAGGDDSAFTGTFSHPRLGWRFHHDFAIMILESRLTHLLEANQHSSLFGTRFQSPTLQWWVNQALRIRFRNLDGVSMITRSLSMGEDIMPRVLKRFTTKYPTTVKLVNEELAQQLLVDPVVTYLELQLCTLGTNLLTYQKNGWPRLLKLIADHEASDLVYHTIFEMVPSVVRLIPSGQNNPLGFNVTQQLAARDSKSAVSAVITFLTARNDTSPSVTMLSNVIVAHIINNVAREYLESRHQGARYYTRTLREIPMVPKPVLEFWFSDVCANDHWYDVHDARAVLDTLCRGLMLLQPVDDSGHDRWRFINDALRHQAERAQRQQYSHLTLGSKKGGNLQNLPPASVLPFGSFARTMAEHPWLTFQCLFEESLYGMRQWRALGEALVAYSIDVPMKTIIHKTMGYGKIVLWECMLRRWLHYAMEAAPSHPLTPLYWQMVFYYYFYRLPTSPQVIGQGNEGLYFGYRLLEGNSGVELLQKARTAIEHLVHHFQLEEERSRQLHEPQINGGSDDDAADARRRRGALLELYMCMNLWLQPRKEKVGTWMLKLDSLPSGYLPDRLNSLVGTPAPSFPWLWWDLVPRHTLRRQLGDEASAYIPLSFFNFVFDTQATTAGTAVTSTPGNYPAVEGNEQMEVAPLPRPSSSSSYLSLSSAGADHHHRLLLSENAPGLANPGGRRPSAIDLTASSLAAVESHRKVAKGSIWSPPAHVAEDCALVIPPSLQRPVHSVAREQKQVYEVVESTIEQYSRRISQRAALDAQLCDMLPNMWRNEQIQVRIQKVCKRRNCRGPAVFLFDVSKAHLVEGIKQSIRMNREEAAECCECAEVDMTFCAALVQIQRMITYLRSPSNMTMTAAPAGRQQQQQQQQRQQSSSSMVMVPMAHVVTIGLEWLRALVALDTSVSRMFPPTSTFIRSCVQSLQVFVPVSFPAQRDLLSQLADHPHLIDSLSPAFKPMDVVDDALGTSSFLHLYKLALTVRNPQGHVSLPLLRRFWISQWLSQHPPMSEIQELYTVCSRYMRSEFRIHSPNEVVTLFEESVLMLNTRYFAPLYKPLCTLLQQGSTDRDLPPLFWARVCQLPMEELSWELVLYTLREFETYFWDIRVRLVRTPAQVTCSLHTVWRPFANEQSFFDFFARLIDVTCSRLVTPQSPPAVHDELWRGVWSVFSAWLAPTCGARLGGVDLGRDPRTAPWQEFELPVAKTVMEWYIRVLQLLARNDDSVHRKAWQLFVNELCPPATHSLLVLYTHVASFATTARPPPQQQQQLHQASTMKTKMEELADISRLLAAFEVEGRERERYDIIAPLVTQLLEAGDYDAYIYDERNHGDDDGGVSSSSSLRRNRIDDSMMSEYSVAYIMVCIQVIGDVAADRPVPELFRRRVHSLCSTVRTWDFMSVSVYERLLERVGVLTRTPQWRTELQTYAKRLSMPAEGLSAEVAAHTVDDLYAALPLVTVDDRRVWVLRLLLLVAQPYATHDAMVVQSGMERIRIFTLWLLQCFQPQQEPPQASSLVMIATPAAYARTCNDILHVCDRVQQRAYRHLAPGAMEPIVQEFVFIMNRSARQQQPPPTELINVFWRMCSAYPSLCLDVLDVCQRLLLDVKTVVGATERLIDTYVRDQRTLAPTLRVLTVPELNVNVYYEYACASGHWWTLAGVLQLAWQDIKEVAEVNTIGRQALMWLDSVHVNVTWPPERCVYVIRVLVGCLVDLAHRMPQTRNACDDIMARLLTILSKWGKSERLIGSLLSFVGLGSKDFQPQFKFLARVLHSYVHMRTRSSHDHIHFNWDGASSGPDMKDREAHIDELRVLVRSKQYMHLQAKSEHLRHLVMTHDKSLRQLGTFVTAAVHELYPELPWCKEWTEDDGAINNNNNK